MDNKQEALDEAYRWLSLRLKRASLIEGELLALAKRPFLSEDEKKRYDQLIVDNKSVSIKDVVGVIDGLQGEDDKVVGFEEFE